MGKKQYIQRLALSLVGAVIFLSYVNKAVFTHSHVLPDGRIIVHAHPYLKHQDEKKGGEREPVNSHHHTPGQYCLLSHHIVYFTPDDPQVQTPVPESGTYYLLSGVRMWKPVPANIFRIRPPPATT